jgi:hypothetical protein
MAAVRAMPKKETALPKFRTEAKEAARWDSHRDLVAEQLEKATRYPSVQGRHDQIDGQEHRFR